MMITKHTTKRDDDNKTHHKTNKSQNATMITERIINRTHTNHRIAHTKTRRCHRLYGITCDIFNLLQKISKPLLHSTHSKIQLIQKSKPFKYSTMNKLYDIFLALPEADRRALQVWLTAPHLNLREDVLRLYDYVLAGGKWEKPSVFVALYGEKPYNDDALRHVQSFLVKAIERYLVETETENVTDNSKVSVTHNTTHNTAHNAYRLARAYHKIGAEKPFLHAFRQYKTAEAAQKTQNTESLYLHAQAENLWFLQTTDKQRTAETNLQAILEAQEKHFAAAQLKMICTVISYQNIHKKEYDFGLLEPLLARVIAQNWQETEPAIGAYFYICKMNTEAESEDFFKILKTNLPLYASVFDKGEQQNCWIFAINYAIKQCNKGNKTFFKELFELYKTGVESGVLLTKNQELSVYTYKNAIATGLRIGETDYVLHFLEQYKKHLPIAERRNYYEYNLARYYFTIRNLAKAAPLLKKLTYGDIFLQLDAKVMLLKIYYETDDFDALDAHLRSFQQFLQRKKTALTYHQQNYLNIIHCTKLLVETNLHDKTAAANLENTIRTMQPLTEREWLITKLM
jgi:hypothetical protein